MTYLLDKKKLKLLDNKSTSFKNYFVVGYILNAEIK